MNHFLLMPSARIGTMVPRFRALLSAMNNGLSFFSEGSGLSGQAWVRDEAFLESDINENWDQDRDITSITYGAGE